MATESQSKRRRISKACDECNKRKVKCDGSNPCATCVKTGKNCTYFNPNKRLKRELQITPSTAASRDSSYDSEHFDSVTYSRPYVQQWTHKDIAELKLLNQNGILVYWGEIYYKSLYKRNALIPKRIFDSHFYDLPIALLHAMISCCQPFSGEPAEVFTNHFDMCGLTKAPWVDPTTLFGILIELHLTIYYVSSSRATSAIYSGTLCIRMGQMLGIHEFREIHVQSATTTAYLPPGLSRELGARCWVYLYCVDFYSRPLFHVPSCIHQDISEELVRYFDPKEKMIHIDRDEYIYTNDSAFGLAISLIPLIRFGRRFYHTWDRNIPLAQKEAQLNNIAVELTRYRTRLPNHPLTTASFSFDERSIWENYVYMIYHFIELLLYVSPYANLIDEAPLDHPGIRTTIHAACSISAYIQAHLQHNPRFDHMPLLVGRVIMLSGTTLAAYGHRDESLKQYVSSHVQALEAIGQYYSSTFYGYAEELKMMGYAPSKAIQHLKTLVL